MPSGLPIRVSAPAKLNLYLHVTGKREDGYHLLDSLVAFPQGIEDVITVSATPSGKLEFTLTGEGTEWLNGKDASPAPSSTNLAIRAATQFCKLTGQPPALHIELEKIIPPGAGLGGGSSDAAATIHALEQFFDLQIPKDDLKELLLGLGADVPVCYEAPRPSRFAGIGEIITPAPALPALPVLLVWPRKHSATPDVFGHYKKPYHPAMELPPSFANGEDLIAFLKTTDNDLSEAAETLHPEIAIVREDLEETSGCLLSRMTGSGSCVFGLYADEKSCDQAAREISALNSSWWVRTGTL